MPWNTLTTKTVGAAITKAELNQLVENIEWLRKRPAFNVVLTDPDLNPMPVPPATAIDGLPYPIVYDDANLERHEQWDDSADIGGNDFTGGIVTDADMSVNGERFEVGDHLAGIWLFGNATNLPRIFNGGNTWRLRKNASERLAGTERVSAWTGHGQGGDMSAHSTIQDFAAGDYFVNEWRPWGGFNGAGITGDFALQADAHQNACWGMWAGDGNTAAGTLDLGGFDPATDDIVDLWNKAVTNLNIWYSRPAAGMRKNADQTGIARRTWTTVTWQTTEFDTYSTVDLGNDRFVVPFDGWYWVSIGLHRDDWQSTSAGTFDPMEPAFAELRARLVRNIGLGNELIYELKCTQRECTDNRAPPGSPNSIRNINYKGTVELTMEGVVRARAGDTLTAQVWASAWDGAGSGADPGPYELTGAGSADAPASNGLNHFRILMVGTRNDNFPAGGQRFTDGLPDLSGIDFTALDTGIAPEGALQAVARDAVNHLLAPPLIVLEMTADTKLDSDGFQGFNSIGKWQQIPFNLVHGDLWGTLDPDVPPAEIVIPVDGLYYVNLRCAIIQNNHHSEAPVDQEGSNDFNAQFGGARGCRILHNGAWVAQYNADSGSYETAPWAKTISTMIVAKAGDRVTAEAFSTSWTNMTLSGDATGTFGDNRLTAVWCGDGYTRDRQSEAA